MRALVTGLTSVALATMALQDDGERDTEVSDADSAFGVVVDSTEEHYAWTGDGNARSRPPTPEELAAAAYARLDGATCTVPAIIPICQVDVPCADAETATNNAASILVGANMPESQCTAPAAAAITDSIVLTAFQDVPLPEATLTIQPPDARTLVNLDTNFYTVAEPFTTSVTLLGSQVDLDISPASYTWTFGDGTVRTTTTPGAAYPDLLVTHAYESTGTVATSVTVTWGARYRVDGGPWADVAGTVDMTSPAVDLEILEATPVLTD